MPVTVPALRSGNVLTPSSVPANRVGVAVSGDQYVFDTTDDFFAPDLPARLGTNVLSTARVVPARFAGMHWHAARPTVRYSVLRNVDLDGCMWWHIESAGRGLYDWSALDAVVAAAALQAQDVVFDFVGTPNWASARPFEPGHYGAGSDAEPALLDDLAGFAGALCARYLARGTPIAAFEVWNEPKFAGGGGVADGNYFSGTPEAMAAMARAIWQAVKAVDPAALVLSPAPTGLERPWTPGDGTGTDHLDRFLAAADGSGGTGRDWVDVVAYHAYSHTGFNDVRAIPQMAANVRACMAAHGLAGRPVWVTETSAIQPPLSTYVPQRQQDFLARTLLLALGSGADRVIWYAWDDPLGFAAQPDVAARWDALVGQLAGATLSVVNSLANGQVAAVVDGQRVLA